MLRKASKTTSKPLSKWSTNFLARRQVLISFSAVYFLLVNGVLDLLEIQV